ncbi:MAG TPA: chemotaxis protein CheW [Thermodesulfobacteriota bacterium]|jgi:purine-binding chemotaxis protein CheW|nr:chemotaxis protein CheW [Thermodesulfobacteriota bacterium]
MSDNKDSNNNSNSESTSSETMSKDLHLEDIELQNSVFQSANIRQTTESIGSSSSSDLSSDSDELDKLISEIDSSIQQNYGQVIMSDFGEEAQAEDIDEQKYIVFTLSNKMYGIPILNVLEIGTLSNVTPVPNLPVWVRGVTNIRGEIVSVVDLGTYLGIPKMDRFDSGRMLVIRSLDEEISSAIIVDQVNQIYNVPKDSIMNTEAKVDDKIAPFLHGVCEFNDELLILLDLEKFFAFPQIRQFD